MKKVLLGIAVVLVGWVLVFMIPWKKDEPQPPKAHFGIAPSNTPADALSQLENAIKDRDSQTFWHSFTYESRTDGYMVHYIANVMWDSTAMSRIAIRIVRTDTFRDTVWRRQDTALFARSKLLLKYSDRNTGTEIRHDTMTAQLRVDNGRWLVASLSLYDHNKPFYGPGNRDSE